MTDANGTVLSAPSEVAAAAADEKAARYIAVTGSTDFIAAIIKAATDAGYDSPNAYIKSILAEKLGLSLEPVQRGKFKGMSEAEKKAAKDKEKIEKALFLFDLKIEHYTKAAAAGDTSAKAKLAKEIKGRAEAKAKLEKDAKAAPAAATA